MIETLLLAQRAPWQQMVQMMVDLDHSHYSDAYLVAALAGVRKIALVGASLKPNRPSHMVMRYLLSQGYDVCPVNPAIAGKTIHDKHVFASLSDIPSAIDMVDVFRHNDAVPQIVDDMLLLSNLPKLLWLQVGVFHMQMARRVEAHGVQVVMNRCPKIEHERLKSHLPKTV